MCHRPISDRCHGKGPRRRLLLRLTSPRTRQVAGKTWPSGVSVSPGCPAAARAPHPYRGRVLRARTPLATPMLAVPSCVPASAAGLRVCQSVDHRHLMRLHQSLTPQRSHSSALRASPRVFARSAAGAVSLTACAATLRLRLCAASRRAPCQAAERASRTGERLGGSVRWHGVGDRGHAVGGKGRLIFLYSAPFRD